MFGKNSNKSIADIEIQHKFTVGNFKIPLPDITWDVCYDFIEKNYPLYEIVDHEVVEYEAEKI